MALIKDLMSAYLSPLSDLNDEIENIRTSEEDKQLITWAEHTYRRVKQERIPLERQWYVNLAFVFGRQNIAVINSQATTTGFQLTIPKAPPWRVRLVINHIRRIIRTETSKLVSQKPRPFVLPNTTEDEDLAAARIGEQIIEATLAEDNVASTIRQWVWWGSVCGTAFLKQAYNHKLKDEDGKQGVIEVSRCTPFEIFVDNLTQEDIEKQPFVLHASTKAPEEVKRMYGVTVAPNAVGTTDMVEDQFLNIVGIQQQKNDKVIVLEYWLKPGCHEQFPEGGMFVVAGGKLCHVQKKHPYNHKQYPFYPMRAMETGRFYGDSIIMDAIPVQRELNRTRSQIVEAKNLMAKPKLIGHKGSINAKMITSEPGQFIGVTPGFDFPKPLEMAPLPQYVFELETRLHADLDDMAGQHEITRGENPSQVTAATALSYLQEQDDTKLAFAVASIEESIAKLGKHRLKLISQFWTTPRLVKIVGKDNILEVQNWQASDLRGNTDVRVEAGSALPRSKAAKQAMLMELFKFAPMPPQEMFKLLDLQGIEKVYEEVLKDKRQAQRENMRMANFTVEIIERARQAQESMGQIRDNTPLIQPNDFDNHEAHIEEHNNFRKGQQYELLPWQVRKEFDMHVFLHREALLKGTVSPIAQMKAAMAPDEQPQEEAPPEQLHGAPGAPAQTQESQPPQGVQ